MIECKGCEVLRRDIEMLQDQIADLRIIIVQLEDRAIRAEQRVRELEAANK